MFDCGEMRSLRFTMFFGSLSRKMVNSLGPGTGPFTFFNYVLWGNQFSWHKACPSPWLQCGSFWPVARTKSQGAVGPVKGTIGLHSLYLSCLVNVLQRGALNQARRGTAPPWLRARAAFLFLRKAGRTDQMWSLLSEIIHQIHSHNFSSLDKRQQTCLY